MPYTFPKHKKNANGTYGPTLHGYYYKAVYYHSQKAKKNAHKTKWKLIAPKQYEEFRVADGDKVEFYKAESGIFGFLDRMSVILGAIQRWHDHNMITTPMYRKLLKRQI